LYHRSHTLFNLTLHTAQLPKVITKAIHGVNDAIIIITANAKVMIMALAFQLFSLLSSELFRLLIHQLSFAMVLLLSKYQQPKGVLRFSRLKEFIGPHLKPAIINWEAPLEIETK